MVVLFGFSTLVFATTATPAITTIAGDASGGTDPGVLRTASEARWRHVDQGFSGGWLHGVAPRPAAAVSDPADEKASRLAQPQC